ncbi:MAG: hypothetical protein MHM6MM_007523 [Cercozoa sp. M6MM]
MAGGSPASVAFVRIACGVSCASVMFYPSYRKNLDMTVPTKYGQELTQTVDFQKPMFPTATQEE